MALPLEVAVMLLEPQRIVLLEWLLFLSGGGIFMWLLFLGRRSGPAFRRLSYSSPVVLAVLSLWLFFAHGNREYFNASSESPLFTSARTYDADSMLDHLKQGADPNIRNEDGQTPLMVAVAECNHNVVRVLLRYGANPYLKDNEGNSALSINQKQDAPLMRAILLHSEPRVAPSPVISALTKKEADAATRDLTGLPGATGTGISLSLMQQPAQK